MKHKKRFYSEEIPIILEIEDRLRIAKQIEKVIQSSIDSKELVCLDIGCSSGVITNYLKKDFKKIIGIDVDTLAILKAKKSFYGNNIKFDVMSGEKLLFKDGSFDFVICHQVYNFVEDPKKLVSEIYRILKPDGLCYFSGRNKYALIEPQYKLPFLSWLPYSYGVFYIKVFNRGEDFFGKNYLSYYQLKTLLRNFKIKDFTLPVIKEPKKFGFKKLHQLRFLKNIIGDYLLPVIPNYIFILKK